MLSLLLINWLCKTRLLSNGSAGIVRSGVTFCTMFFCVVEYFAAHGRPIPLDLILDEAQHIKNFQSQRWQTLINFNTQRRLLLTG